MKRARLQKGWSAQRLASEMTSVGVKWERQIVTKLETGRRQFVTVDELLALAYVLDVSPLGLLFETDNEQRPALPVTPETTVDPVTALKWALGDNFYGLGLRRWLSLGDEESAEVRAKAEARMQEMKDRYRA